MANPTAQVDGYIRKNKKWEAELSKLRQIVLACGLTEDLKWRTPCYTLDGANVLLVGAGPEDCVLSLLKGVLLKDPKKLLQIPGPNSQAARVIRFTQLQQIVELEQTLTAYIHEAIEIEKSGAKVAFKKVTDFAVPEELQARLDADPALKAAFNKLTPGRQRGYLIFISAAKQSETRAARVEKYIPSILAGKGLDD